MLQGLPETYEIGARTQEWLVDPRACPAMNAYRMRLAGLSKAVKGFCWVRHQPDMSQVAVCYEGWGEILLNGSWQRCEAGMAFLTPLHVPHAYRAVGNSSWGLAWVAYEHSQVASEAVVLMPADPWPLRHTIQGLYRETRHAGDTAAACQWLELVHGYALQLAGPFPRPARLTAVWAAVDADLRHRWTGGELARLAHLGSRHLCRVVWQQYGRSPMRQVTHLRIQRAATLLSRTEQKIEAIALAVGFASLPSFSAAFKHHLGVSPAAFRSHAEA
ncbi:MAG: AraC family transcriptional regulator [Lentisphaeria bacterium]|jgi:AraC-like DNA-binding protein